ncbi:MAG: hypothetical protein WC600_19180 [Desulfobaccales bacterium]
MTSRTLLYFPIVHSQADMGALSESIRKVTLQKFGERVWRQKVNLVKRFWSDVENILNKLTLSYAQTRVYQDGLPVCGKELDIVTELAKKGSPNHQILVRLMEKGATVMGTESAELLIEEYNLIKRILETGDVKDAIAIEVRQKAASDLLLKKRDEFIAARIDQTLQTGETGVLFLGMLHNISALLPEDMEVSNPMNRPLTASHEVVIPAGAGIQSFFRDSGSSPE